MTTGDFSDFQSQFYPLRPGPSLEQQAEDDPNSDYQQIQDVLGQGGTSFTGGDYDLAAQVSALYDKIGALHLTGGTQALTPGLVLQGWDAQGIDTSNPAVVTAAQLAAHLPEDQQGQFLAETGSAFATDSKYAKPTGNYYQALEQFGLTDVTFRPQSGAEENANTTSGGTKEDVLGNGPHPHFTPAETVKFVNGVYYYADGVIADTAATGVRNGVLYDGLYYSPDSKAPGSPVWLGNAQRSWSDDKIESWREELRRLGYNVTRKGGWDTPLLDATRVYYAVKYFNGGHAVPLGPAGGATGGDQTPALDLHQLHASIQSQVQQQYQSVFGEDPTADELRSWTRFVINTGMQLQKGGPRQSLTPSAALGEAEARAARQITTSPESQAAIEHNDENTSLHDALVSAIAATRGLA
jgi:hypothetical protein